MLTPEYLQHAAEGAEAITEDLHNRIMRKIVKAILTRMERGENYMLTAADKWRIEALQEAGYLLEDIQKEIAKATNQQLSEIKSACIDAGIQTLKWDDAVYTAAGLVPTPLLLSPTLMRVLERDYKATAGTWRNFTRTTAEEAQRLFINELDSAYHRVLSGGESYGAVVADLIEKVSDEGLTVKYPTGYRQSLESATMTIVRTGIAQAACDVSETRMEEMDWDIILVSAHVGARTGDGGQNPGNHLWWQGRFYSRTGKNKKYPNFYEVTGYGTGEGLGGWNCRHSFGSGDGKNNPFDAKNISYADNRKVEEAQKRQRLLERRIRNSKRQIQTLQYAIDNASDDETKSKLQSRTEQKANLLSKQNKAYRKFCEDNNLRPYDERLKIAHWDRKQAARAAADARRYQKRKKEKADD